MSANAVEGRVLILGVGNILWADEGFGVRCVEALGDRFAFPPNVTLLDGGTQGLLLIDPMREATHAIIFDAVDFGGAPGELSVVRDEAIPAFVGARAMSLHQTGMVDVMALSRLLGWQPDALTLIGVQPVLLEDYGGSLTQEVRAQINPALDAALSELARWGVAHAARPAFGEDADIVTPALALHLYEGGRPSAEAACRMGDERVLAQGGLNGGRAA
ncbi:MAG: HyaD/HybD family hydrogenase maturation endopeptidase [Rhizobiaceae bacterium]|jgi:hydrogenase maturation protease|nr:HyaD/HybD family hydrogenase maturation endopeptidase [Rhizobiaceae bacterium]